MRGFSGLAAAIGSMVLALLPLLTQGHEALARPIALETIQDVRDIVDVSIAPDGQRVAATVVSSTAQGGQRHIWLTGHGMSQPRQLTFSPDAIGSGESQPQWSTDGKSIFFRATQGGVGRVSRLTLSNGSSVVLHLSRASFGRTIASWGSPTEPDKEVRQRRFSLSPDGHWLAIIGNEGTDEPTPAQKLQPLDDAFVVAPPKADKPQLYLLDLSAMRARRIALDNQVQSLNWAPDSRSLVVVTGDEDDLSGYRGHAWRVSITDGATTRINGVADTISTAAWSRHGLAYLARCEETSPPECLQLFAWDESTGTSRALTQGIQGSLRGEFVVDADGQHVVIPIVVGLEQRLARISLHDGRCEWIHLPQPVAFRLTTNVTRSAWAVLASGPGTPKSILVADRLDEAFTALVIPPLVPPHWPTAIGNHLEWRTDGQRLEGLLYLPSVPSRAPAPLVVWVHGGPYSAFQNRYYRLVNVLASMGWAVLVTNPRGSMGYGAAFASANRNDLGGRDYADIMAGVDAALAHYPLDPKRMAMIGYSYGGTMVAFTEGRTNRFKALVAGAPVIDQISEYGTEDSSFDDQWYFGKPWEHPSAFWRQSPLARVSSARTPLLLLQGEADEVDPMSQSQAMRRAMLQIGAPVTLVIYPRETHGSLAQLFGMGSSREPFHGVDLARRVIAFLSKAFADG